MSVTYCGVDLVAPDRRALDQFDRWAARHAEPFDYPGYHTAGIHHLPVPQSPVREVPRPGVLVWPCGSASRWAVFHHLCSGEQLDQIRGEAGSSGGTLTLKEDAPGREAYSVSADMWVLPPRPAFQLGSKEIYLLTLVDERYWWWMTGARALFSAPTWEELVLELVGAAGATTAGTAPVVDAVDAAYGLPDPARWSVGYKPVPLLLDAACETVGLRLVRTPGGVVHATDWPTADAADSAQWALWRPDRVFGGRRSAADVGSAVPAGVAVVFPGTSPARTLKTMTEAGAAALFSPSTGVGGRYANVHADLAATAPSASRDAYATRAALDWYRWSLGLTDATFRGIVPWVPTGQEDRVEWEATPGRVCTRVVPPPYADQSQWGGLPAQEASAPETVPVWLVTRVCESGTSGNVVEQELFNLPASAYTGVRRCLVNPADCCANPGTGTGTAPPVCDAGTIGRSLCLEFGELDDPSGLCSSLYGLRVDLTWDPSAYGGTWAGTFARGGWQMRAVLFASSPTVGNQCNFLLEVSCLDDPSNPAPCATLGDPATALTMTSDPTAPNPFTTVRTGPLFLSGAASSGHPLLCPYGTVKFVVTVSEGACAAVTGTGTTPGVAGCCLPYLSGRTAVLVIPDGPFAGTYGSYPVVVSGDVASAVFRVGSNTVTFRCNASGGFGPYLEFDGAASYAGPSGCNGGAGPYSASWAPGSTNLGAAGTVTLTV